MKRVFLVLCLIPALLLCSCGAEKEVINIKENRPTEETDPLLRPDLEEHLGGIASEVVVAYGSGKFEDVEQYMLYSFDEQVDMLFKDQTAPYQYEGHTFETKDAIKEAVRSQLISGENSDFTITVTKTDMLLYPGDYQYGSFGFDDDPIELEFFGYPVSDLKMAASMVVSFTIENGEEASGSMYVNFLLVGDEWKVFSPSVMGFFLQLYKPVANTHEPVN